MDVLFLSDLTLEFDVNTRCMDTLDGEQFSTAMGGSWAGVSPRSNSRCS